MDSYCPVCFDDYDLSVREKLPYNLKCGHVCCHVCLVKLKTGSAIPPSKENERNFLLYDIKNFKCPICRMKNPDISPLRFSENIQNFISKIKDEKILEANLKGHAIIEKAEVIAKKNIKAVKNTRNKIFEEAESLKKKTIFEANLEGRAIIEQAEVKAEKDIHTKILAEAESLRFASLEREIQILKEKQYIKTINVFQNWEETSFTPRKKRRISNT